MIKNKKVIAVIPARGGSKTIPYKNIKMIAGKPLIAWTIEAAKKTEEIDYIVVSTEDTKIKKIVEELGVEVINRPKHLAQDDTLAIDVVRDVISQLEKNNKKYDFMVYLEPTSPLRESTDIKKALTLLVDENNRYDSIATFSEASLNPIRAWEIKDNSPKTFIKDASTFLPRQKLPKAYQLNGAVYCFHINRINNKSKQIYSGKIGAIIMPKEKSVDIDDELDFMLAELLLKRRLSSG